MKFSIAKALIVGFAASWISAPALRGAVVVYDNSNSPWTSNMSVSSYFYQAQSFRTGNEDAYLHTISLGLLANEGVDAPFVVQIYDGLYSGLGTPVTTLTGPTNPGTGLIAYVPSAPVLLAADTTYWVLARAYGATSSGSFYGWRIADLEPSAGMDSGRNMYYADTVHQWVGPTGPGDFVMRVETIPEPAASLLFAGSFLMFVGFRRRGCDAGEGPKSKWPGQLEQANRRMLSNRILSRRVERIGRFGCLAVRPQSNTAI